MELFGIGALEFLFILVIILLVAGPKDIARTARNLGRALNRLYKSPGYMAIRRASDELRGLPQRLAREAQLEELKELKELKDLDADLKGAANTIGAETKAFEAWINDKDQLTAAPPSVDPPAVAAPPPRRTHPGVPRPETTSALKASNPPPPPIQAEPPTTLESPDPAAQPASGTLQAQEETEV
jgi:sec-independent protein translocase protein TatB